MGWALTDIYPGEALYLNYGWSPAAWKTYTDLVMDEGGPTLQYHLINTQMNWRETFVYYKYTPNCSKTITKSDRGMMFLFLKKLPDSWEKSFSDDDDDNDEDFVL